MSILCKLNIHSDEYTDPGFTCSRCNMRYKCKHCGSENIHWFAGIGAYGVKCYDCRRYQ